MKKDIWKVQYVRPNLTIEVLAPGISLKSMVTTTAKSTAVQWESLFKSHTKWLMPEKRRRI